jgi:hypothetical protein
MPAQGAAMAAPSWAAKSRAERCAELRLLKDDISGQFETQLRDQADDLCRQVDSLVSDVIYQLPKRFREIRMDAAFQVAVDAKPRDPAALQEPPAKDGLARSPKRVRDGQTQTVLYARKKVKSAGEMPEDEPCENMAPHLVAGKGGNLVNLTPLQRTAPSARSDEPEKPKGQPEPQPEDILPVPVGRQFSSMDPEDRQAWLMKLGSVLQDLLNMHNTQPN